MKQTTRAIRSGSVFHRPFGVAALLGWLVFLIALLASLFFKGGFQSGAPEEKNSAKRPPVAGTLDLPVYHVDTDAATASDENPGSPSAPLRTIGEAVSRAERRNEAARETRIVIHPGIYRETVELPSKEGTTDAPITLEGLGEGVVVSGSDVWGDWERFEGSIYRHHWPYKWGARLPPIWEERKVADYLARNPVILRREMIFVEGTPLEQVLSISELRKTSESFYVSEVEERVYIHPGESVDISEANVEVAVRSSVVQVTGRKNVTLENLTMVHAASSVQSIAVSFSNSSGIRVSNSKIHWNSSVGLHFRDSEGVVVRNTSANFNGISGFSAYYVEDILFEDTETSHNNWRGSRGAEDGGLGRAIDPNFVDFAAGQKFFGLREATFRRHRSVGNLSGGLWFDSDNSGVTLDSVTLIGNMTHGVFFEANQGPLVVRRSLICGNETGVLISNSSSVSIEENVLTDNRLAQIFIAGRNERAVKDRRTGTVMRLKSEDFRVFDNRIASGDKRPAVATYLEQAEWDHFVATLRSDRNSWLYSGNDRVFEVARGARLNLDEWRSHTLQDAGSSSAPAGLACTQTG